MTQTHDGKVDGNVLAGLEPLPVSPLGVTRAELEARVAALFAAVLGRAAVSPDDDFFTLGGHPVLAVRLLDELRSAIGADLELSHVLENPTPAALAAILAPGDDKEDGYLPIVAVGRGGALACTVQQEGLWFEYQLNPQAATYHIAFALRLTGELDVAALRRALHALVVRHEALRTRFTDHGGLPRQVIDPPPAEVPLPVAEIGSGELEAWAAWQVAPPMDLAAGPLVRFALARTGSGEHVLVLVVHHLVADGWSARIMAGELSQLYSAATTGEPAVLVPLPVQPADYAAWQRRWLEGAELDRQLGFWREKLAGLPTLDFPADRPRPAEPAGAGATLRRRLPDAVAMAAREYARVHQVSFLAALHAALLVVLHRWTGQTDLPVGSVFSGRTRAETEPMVGFFINTVVLRASVDGDPSFAGLVRRCHDTVLDATAHQEVPFGMIVDALQPERVTGRHPLYQISLTLHPARTALADVTFGDLGTESSVLPTGCSRFDIAFDVTESASGPLELSAEFSTELFDADRVERLLDHFTAVLAGGLAAPDGAVAGLEMMSAAERRQVLHAGNPEPDDREPGLLHEVTAGHDPARVAFRFRGSGGVEELTYGELEAGAGRLAHVLRRMGVRAGDVVALLLDRGPRLTIAQFAVMKAGAAWMPMDPQNPPARLAFQVRDAAARLVLTTAGLAGLAGPGARCVLLDDPQVIADIGGQPAGPPEAGVRPDDAAYVFYTSGSTGTPKGVLVAHRSAYAYCQNAVQEYRSTLADRVAQVSNPAFDASLFDCFATLLAGATMVGAPREVTADPGALTTLLREEKVTLSYLPPALLAVLDPARLAGTAMRAVFTGGEALPAEQVRRWARPGLELHNCYGPTEATLYCISYVCPAGAPDTPPPIGTALPNHRAYVLDTWLRPVPAGVPGQLFIAGVGLAHGYLNRPGLTAGRFLADPFAGRPGERMYATGDLVRRRADGILDFLGRTDRQVKLRGQRVELGEIEHALSQHPAVGQAVVRPLRDMLVAYLVPVPGGDIDQVALREHLADRLPTYMIPARYLTIAGLPLTPNGKLDPAALPDPAPQAADYIAPRTPAEQWLAATWTDLLGLDRAGAADNFFELGGNSLHITQLIARIRDHYDIQLTARQLFTSSGLEQLAALIDTSTSGTDQQGPELDDDIAELERLLAEKRAAKAKRAELRKIAPVGRGGALACTVQQEGLWFEYQLNPQAATYHIAFALRLTGELDVAALRRALHALVVRHEALRTRFTDHGGLPRQVIDPPPAEVPLPVAEIAPGEVQSWTGELVNRRMDLAAGPLVRFALARTGSGEHVLVLVVHHLVADGWSARIMAGELSQLYSAATTGEPAVLVPLPVQPADYAAWQRRWLEGAELDRQLGFWREKLAGLPTLDFPADRPRPAEPALECRTLVRRLPDAVAMAAREYARVHQVSFLAVLHAALLVVLHRWTGQTDLPVGSVFSGRTRAETEPMVGHFTNTLVLRTGLEGDPSFAGLVRRCHDTVLDATAHQEVPFGMIVDALQPEHIITSGQPLFRISLTLYPPGASLGGLQLSSITAEPLPLEFATTFYSDVTIGVTHAPDGTLDVSVLYATELFEAGRIERLLDHITAALTGGLADPDGAVSALDVMNAAERARVLHAFNQTAVSYPPVPLHDLIEATAATTPEALAVIDHDGARHTYRQLDIAANQLAHRLRSHGVGPATRVGVCLPRGIDLVTALLATWKAGAAYVPLDPELPAERLAYLMADAGPAVVISATGDARVLVDHARPAGAGPAMIEIDTERDSLAREPAGPLARSGGLDDTAYVLYTSGSTGTPKGVVVSHRGIHNRIAWAQDTYQLQADDRVLQKTPYSFDVSVWEFFWPLTVGATLVLAAPGGHRDQHYLHRLITDEAITTMHFVPTMLDAFLDAMTPDYPAPGPLARLRRVFCSGEALAAETARRFLATWPEVGLHNLYGPTEASIDVTAWRCRQDGGPVPIGQPIANHRAYVLDTWLRPVPAGVPGQLFIAGVGLAHGYLNRPGLTAGRFLADPFAGRPGERMYATGDLVRRRADGILDFLGRTDRQVKLRGQRVELGEIEHALSQHPAVGQAVVRPLRDMLVAYLVPVPGGDIDQVALREHLADRLPTYMIPARYLTIAGLPLTPNGKLDPAALPDPAPQAADYIAPRTPAEQWLAATWTDLLGLDRAGAADNFFELGGNSLHITQLIARIRDHYDIQLTARQLFTHEALEHLAALIDRTVSQQGGEISGSAAGALTVMGSDARLIAFRSAGTLPPLFLVHPLGGSVTCYAQLAQALGEDRPVYGIEDPALHGDLDRDLRCEPDGEPPAGGLAGRASRYAEVIRRQQPHGPYLVGGWSFGGWIAYEMGRQLAVAGEKAAVFALDTGIPPEPYTPSDLEVIAEFVIDLARVTGAQLPDVDLDALEELDRESLEEMALDVLIDAGATTPDLRADLRARMRAFAGNYRAALGYKPGRFDGPMVLITAADNDATRDTCGWKDLAAALERHTAGGDHYSMLRAPHQIALAATLRDALHGATQPDPDQPATRPRA